MKNIRKSALIEFIFLLPQVIRVSPIGFCLFAITSVFHAILWFLVVKSNQVFYDSLLIFSENKVEIDFVLMNLLTLSIVQISKHIFNGISNYIPIMLKAKINEKMTYKFHSKIGSLDASLFEKTDFIDDLEKAKRGKSEVAWNTVTLFSIVFFYLPYFVLMAHYLFSLKPILVVLILIIFIPVIIAQYGKKWIFSITEDVATPLKREKNYYMNCIVSKEYFKETRMLGAFDFFINLFRETSNSINSLQHKANKKATIINLVLQLASLGGYVGVLILLFNAVVDSKVSVGAFAAVFQGVTDIYKLLEEVVYSSIGGMIRDLGYIKNFTRFMNFDDSDKVTISSDLNMIELKSVNFKYPISNTYALKDINITFDKKEIVAVVGENGSGKSTLMKLIAGIYFPTEGEIHYEGKEKSKEKRALLDRVSAVFQNYQKYSLSLGENIGISEKTKNYNKERLDFVCANSNVNFDDCRITIDV